MWIFFSAVDSATLVPYLNYKTKKLIMKIPKVSSENIPEISQHLHNSIVKKISKNKNKNEFSKSARARTRVHGGDFRRRENFSVNNLEGNATR